MRNMVMYNEGLCFFFNRLHFANVLDPYKWVPTSSLFSLLANPTTIIPLSTSRLHVAAPIPDDAPVTTATFPTHLSIFV